LARAQSGGAGDTPYIEIYADETLGWGAIAENLAVVDVEGGHSSMLQEPFVDSLVTILLPHLGERPEMVSGQRTERIQSKDRELAAVKDFVLNS
jgi:hypothetical protein